MIATLKRLVPTTEKEIDRHYYYCYGDGKVEVEQTGSVVVYVVRGESRVNGYLENRYGKGVPQHAHDLRLQSVNVFDARWTSKFGYPQVDTSFNQNDFSGSFSCLNTGAAVKGYGQITAVNADYIEAKDQSGKNKRFRVGGCTRIESSTPTPEIGQGFYFEAVPSSADGYNLYAATCI